MILHYERDEMLELIKTLLDALLVIFLFFGGVFTLSMPIESFTQFEYALAVIGASIAGAVVLLYYRRELSYKEMFFKAGCCALSGLVFGSLTTTYFAVERTPYVFSVYFFSAMLSMFFIRGLLSVTEQNASGLVITVLQRFLSVGAANNYSALPKVTPEKSVAPDTVITETEVTVKKETEI